MHSESQPQSMHHPMLFLPLSVLGAVVCSIAFNAALRLGLPETDLAYGESPFAYADIAMLFGGVLGLFFWPVGYFLLRRSRLMRSVPLAYACTLFTVISVTYWFGPLGIYAGLGVALSSLIFCRFSAWAREPVATEPLETLE